ncbi:hypothetical protein TNCV_1390331 [Trichonephila clavipes]|nr:hypothetical protein TNCV_1390331 [Trichonephila clavipes]
MAEGSLMVRASDSKPESLVQCLNCGGVAIYRKEVQPVSQALVKFISSLQDSKLRPTTDVHLAPCLDELYGPRCDYVRQVA